MGNDKFAIVIQAGGKSSRMVRDASGETPLDKALVPFLGKPLIQRQVERLEGLGADVWVITNHPQAYAFLSLPLLTDLVPGAGPLGGLYTALKRVERELIAVVACDMPFISAELLAAQRDLLEREGVDVVIPHSAEGLEPLHAVYRRETCLPPVSAALERGERRVISWFPSVRVREMPIAEVERFDPGLRSFINVNRWDEFQRAEDLARRSESSASAPTRRSGQA